MHCLGGSAEVQKRMQWGLTFIWTMPYPYHFEFVELGSRLMFIKVEINKNRFITNFALCRRECRSAQMKGVRIDIYLHLIFYLNHFEFDEFWNTVLFMKVKINKNGLINSFGLCRRECRSAQMKGVSFIFYLDDALPELFRIRRIWRKNNVCKSTNK